MPRSALAEVHADAEAVRSRAHVGVLVPWANTMIETELPRVGLEPLVFHYARIVPARRYRESDAFLQQPIILHRRIWQRRVGRLKAGVVNMNMAVRRIRGRFELGRFNA